MNLPDDDVRYLNEKGFDWQLVADGPNACVVIKGYPVDVSRYDREATDILLRVPAQYPLAGLDMFYAEPWVKLRSGSYPPAAEVAQDLLGRRWQRFSRHLKEPWRPGHDGLSSFLALVAAELSVKE